MVVLFCRFGRCSFADLQPFAAASVVVVTIIGFDKHGKENRVKENET